MSPRTRGLPGNLGGTRPFHDRHGGRGEERCAVDGTAGTERIPAAPEDKRGGGGAELPAVACSLR